MKDESKAKWPETMKQTALMEGDGFNEIELSGSGLRSAAAYGFPDIVKYRAKQICALPRMVALLKRIKSMNEDVSGHIWFPQEILDTVESILRDIGEVE